MNFHRHITLMNKIGNYFFLGVTLATDFLATAFFAVVTFLTGVLFSSVLLSAFGLPAPSTGFNATASFEAETIVCSGITVSFVATIPTFLRADTVAILSGTGAPAASLAICNLALVTFSLRLK